MLLRPLRQPQRHPGRHLRFHDGRRGQLDRFRLGERRLQNRGGLRGRDRGAPADAPLPERQGYPDGDPVLAQDQPDGLQRFVAGPQAGRRPVQRHGRSQVRGAEGPAQPGGFALLYRGQQPGPPLPRRLGPAGHGARARVGPEIRADLIDHRRSHDQPRLQPGRERRFPGDGQPALSDLLR